MSLAVIFALHLTFLVHSSSCFAFFLNRHAVLAQVANRETSAPFDQRFAFKFKCFLLTGSKSSLPRDDDDDDAPPLLLPLPLRLRYPSPTLTLPHSLSLALSLSVVLAVSLSVCGVCKRSFSNFIVSVSEFLTPNRL